MLFEMITKKFKAKSLQMSEEIRTQTPSSTFNYWAEVKKMADVNLKNVQCDRSYQENEEDGSHS